MILALHQVLQGPQQLPIEMEDELPAVRTRQVPSSQGSQKTLETENKPGVRTAMLAASAENLTASQALLPVQLLIEKNFTGQ